MNLPSKELLSEVLGVRQIAEVSYEFDEDFNTYFIRTNSGKNREYPHYLKDPTITIVSDLAHKCKEWAFSNKWLVNERQSITGKYEYQCMSFSGNMFTPSFDNVFDLCQWILENR